MPASNGHTIRRSSRVKAQVPIRVTSLEPNAQFSEVCETLVVSAHGCALRFPVKLDAGSVLRFDSRAGRQTTAYVVACQPLDAAGQSWQLGARLDRPENFWGLESCPEDWRVLEMPAAAAHSPARRLPAGSAVVRPQTSSKASQAFLDKLEEQLSEERLQGILAKLVHPMQAEVAELREKLVRNARQNRFEVSLGQIPAELEEKLWQRLKEELGTQVLQQTREQSSAVLGSAKTAIEQQIAAAIAEFRNRLTGELHAVQQRAQALSKELTTMTQQQVHAGVEKLQHQVLDAGAQLNSQSEKLLGSLQRRLAESHDAHRRELEQTQADASAKTIQIKAEVGGLGARIEVLNEAVRRLESDLDAHLEHVAGEIVAAAKAQLESAVSEAFKELQKQGANEVETRVNEACGHLRTVQNRIEDSFSGSLKAQGEDAVSSIARQFEELAQQSVERWRLALARDLNSVAQTLGQQLRQELASGIDQS